MNPPPPTPPPVPMPPPPPPAACSAPCAGSTCGAFGTMTCDEFTNRLGCDCSGCCTNDGNLQCIISKWPANLPNLYSFTEGYAGSSIRDGGGDMYDGGNHLNVRIDGGWHVQLPYTQDCHGQFPAAFPGVEPKDAEYSTCKLLGDTHTRDTIGERTAGTLFAASFTSKTSKIDAFAITGNLGADGGGSQLYVNITGPKGVRGYFKQVYGAQGDPSVNHLIVVRSDLEFHAPTLTTDSDWHYVSFPRGVPVLYYLLWAGKLPSLQPGGDYSRGYKYQPNQVQTLLNDISESCFGEAAGFPPAPPPPPADTGPIPDACNQKCGETTCLAFRHTVCSIIEPEPWGCSCWGCCIETASPPPPSPPPSPPLLPPPNMPLTCNKECAGSTCGAFMPYSCHEFSTNLGCDCTGCCETPLNTRCVDRVWATNANLPSLQRFSDGLRGTSIRDGYGDMYDYGNFLSVKSGANDGSDGKPESKGHWSNNLPYTQTCDGPPGAGRLYGPDGDTGEFVTCKYSSRESGYGSVFVTVVSSVESKINGFLITGNLGADGPDAFNPGMQKANNCTVDDNSPQYCDSSGGTEVCTKYCLVQGIKGHQSVYGYWKKTWGAQNDPSVNHLIFAQGPNAAQAMVTIGHSTDSDNHQVEFLDGGGKPVGVSTLYYVLFAGKNGFEYKEHEFVTVMNNIADECLAGVNTDYGNDQGGLNAGGVFGIIVLVITILGCCCFGVYAYKKGWQCKVPSLPSFKGRGSTGRAQTTPSFDSTGPLSTTQARGTALAANDSATPYQAPTPI